MGTALVSSECRAELINYEYDVNFAATSSSTLTPDDTLKFLVNMVYDTPIMVAPEPGIWALMGVGLCGLVFVGWRKKSAAATATTA